MSAGRTLLAIPVYNEAAHLQTVLSHARHYLSDILVIDDGSTDDTPRLLALETRLTVIHHNQNLGYGRSLADAFDHAIQAGYNWLITMDCDWQHEPSHIPEFITAARTDHWDIVSGSRYLADAADQSVAPADRRTINRRVTALLNDHLGLHLTDAFCGFKVYRVAGLRSLRITVPGYAMPLQLWVQAWRAGLRISELPVKLIYNDPNRHFGGDLDDPAARLAHYVATLTAELEAVDASGPPASAATWLPTSGRRSDSRGACGESSSSVDAAPCCSPHACE